MKIFFTLTLFFILHLAYAQPFETTVTSIYLINSNLCLESTSDGGCILFNGMQYSALLMMKFDSTGNIAWVKQYSDVGMDKATSLGANHFLVYGNYTTSYWPYQIASAIHVFDSSGVLEYNYVLPESLIVSQLHSTKDGGTIAILPGDANQIIPSHICKTDSLGNVEWDKTLDSLASNVYQNGFQDIAEVTAGGYIGIYDCNCPDTNLSAYSAILFRLNAEGDTLWTKTLTPTLDGFRNVLNAPSNHYFFFGGNAFAMMDSSGQVLWSKSARNNALEFAFTDCKLSRDSNFIFTGYYLDTTIFSWRTCLIKVDTTGNIIWATSFKRLNGGIPVCSEGDKGVAILSPELNVNSSTLIKTDSSGISRCSIILQVPPFADSAYIHPALATISVYPSSLQLTIVPGTVNPILYPAFSQADSCIILSQKEISPAENSIRLVPNPATESFVVYSSRFANGQLEIYNSLGEKIYSSSFNQQQKINCENFQEGIYFVRLKDNEKVICKKLIVQ
jgi:hypothetical protein